MIPLLASGALDVAFASAVPASLNAVAKGARVRIVAAREVAVPGCIHEIYGNRKSFPQGLTAGSLRGKRIAMTAPTSLSAFLLDTILASAGLGREDVRPQYMRVREGTAALVAGQIDALAEKDMDFSSPEIIPGPSVADIVPGFQYSYIQFGRNLLDGDIQTGAAFLWAFLRGVRAFRSGKTPAVFDRLAESGGMDPAVVRGLCRNRFTIDGRIDPASIQRMSDWALSKGFIPARVEAAGLIDNRFLDQALRRMKEAA
jgi:ABC-type nitrate/sulfonate/bicarbonate transport system substrate-binding protein